MDPAHGIPPTRTARDPRPAAPAQTPPASPAPPVPPARPASPRRDVRTGPRLAWRAVTRLLGGSALASRKRPEAPSPPCAPCAGPSPDLLDTKHTGPAAGAAKAAQARAARPVLPESAEPHAIAIGREAAGVTSLQECFQFLNRVAIALRRTRDPVLARALVEVLRHEVSRAMDRLPPERLGPWTDADMANFTQSLVLMGCTLYPHPIDPCLPALALRLCSHLPSAGRRAVALEAWYALAVGCGPAPAATFARALFARLGRAALDPEGFADLAHGIRDIASRSLDPSAHAHHRPYTWEPARDALVALAQAATTHAPAGDATDSDAAGAHVRSRVNAITAALVRGIDQGCPASAYLLAGLLDEGATLPAVAALAGAIGTCLPGWLHRAQEAPGERGMPGQVPAQRGAARLLLELRGLEAVIAARSGKRAPDRKPRGPGTS